MLNPDVALDIDIWGAVSSMVPSLIKMAIRPQLLERKEEIQRSDDIVDLRKYRVFAVDHRNREPTAVAGEQESRRSGQAPDYAAETHSRSRHR